MEWQLGGKREKYERRVDGLFLLNNAIFPNYFTKNTLESYLVKKDGLKLNFYKIKFQAQRVFSK